MNPRALRYFAYVADSRSFSKAAALLHIGQPALSRSIQQLEEDLGVELLRRSSRRIEVTPAGQILRVRAQALLDQLDLLRSEVRAHADVVSGTVTVSVPSAAGQLIVPAITRRIAEDYPGIRLNIFEGLSSETLDRLIAQSVHIGLLYDPVANRDLFNEPLATEQMCLVGRRDKIEALGPLGGVSAIGNLPLVLPGSPNSRRLLVERAFSENGVTLNVVAQVDGFATTHALLKDGFAFSLMTRAGAMSSIGGPEELAAIPIPGPELTWRLEMVRHRAQSSNPVVSTTAAVVRDAVAALVAKGEWEGIELVAEDGLL